MLAVEEHRVVDGERGPPRKIFRQLDVRIVVPPVRRRDDERDRPEHPAAGAKRNDHRGAQAELAQVSQVLVVLGGSDEHLVRHLGVELGDARADHVRDPRLRARVDRVALAEASGELDLAGVGVGDHDAVQVPAFVDHLDSAPVRDVAHRQRRELVERRFGVE